MCADRNTFHNSIKSFDSGNVAFELRKTQLNYKNKTKDKEKCQTGKNTQDKFRTIITYLEHS